MKKFYTFTLLIFALSMTQLSLAYTYTITNATSRSVSVEVVLTWASISKPSQTKTIAPNETKQFVFDKWYNKGLCLNNIKVNGLKFDATATNSGRYVPIDKFGCKSASFTIGHDIGDEFRLEE